MRVSDLHDLWQPLPKRKDICTYIYAVRMSMYSTFSVRIC